MAMCRMKVRNSEGDGVVMVGSGLLLVGRELGRGERRELTARLKVWNCDQSTLVAKLVTWTLM
jgi:hypothetical protein